MVVSFPSVPFYCKRFRGNCSVRRDNICCRQQDIATAEIEEEKEYLGVGVDSEKDKELEDHLVASSSIINEVVVSPDEAPVSVQLAHFLSKYLHIPGSA